MNWVKIVTILTKELGVDICGYTDSHYSINKQLLHREYKPRLNSISKRTNTLFELV
jgi:hypothetical protein